MSANPYGEPTPQQKAAAWVAMAWNELDKLRGKEPRKWKKKLQAMKEELRGMVAPIEGIKGEISQ